VSIDQALSTDLAADTVHSAPSFPLVVVEGSATEEEVAALLAVLAASSAAAEVAAEVPEQRRRSEWASPARAVRRSPPAGPGGWRASGLPH